MSDFNSIIVIDQETVSRLASREMAKIAVRAAFEKYHKGDGKIFPVAIGNGAPEESMIAIKSGRSRDLVGFKVGTYWPNNDQYGIPNHAATTVLLDGETGIIRAVVNVSSLNGLRTAAADALAVETLSRKDSEVLAVIGTGHQSLYETQAILDVRQIKQINLWNRSPEKAAAFAEKLREFTSADISIGSRTAEDAIRNADIIVTATTSQEALFSAGAVKAGTHISAMGADKAGKKELDEQLVARANLFADAPNQSIQIGEFQHAAKSKLLEPNSITALGKVLCGDGTGRRDDQEITIFDSSGIALQDVEVANQIVNSALESGLANSVRY